MRLEELFANLGQIAGNFASQMRQVGEGLPLEDLDLTGPAPRHVSLVGPAQVVLREGPMLRVDVDSGPAAEGVRFALREDRFAVSGGDGDTIVRVTLPAPAKLVVAGSGRMTAEKLAKDGEISIAGSGRLEVAAVEGGHVAVSIAGSGRLALDGVAEELALSIAGSGSCDAEGLVVDKAAVHIAGSGDAIFTCNGEVAAHLMGSGNVIVRGSARCSIHSMGSGTVTCEREAEAAD